MKKVLIWVLCSSFILGSAVLPATSVLAYENDVEVSSQKNTSILEPGVSVQADRNGDIIVTKYETRTRANVSRWGGWTYTNIAVTTGVAANAINAAFYAGVGVSVSMFGIPGWAIGALLTGASWTSLGSSPGNAVAKKWDTSGNGWIGFHMRKGYDAAGRHVATKYKTM